MRVHKINNQQTFKAGNTDKYFPSEFKNALDYANSVIFEYNGGKYDSIGLCSHRETKELGLAIGSKPNPNILYGLDFVGKDGRIIYQRLIRLYLKYRKP